MNISESTKQNFNYITNIQRILNQFKLLVEQTKHSICYLLAFKLKQEIMKDFNVSVIKRMLIEILYKILYTKKVQRLFKMKFKIQNGIKHNHSKILNFLELTEMLVQMSVNTSYEYTGILYVTFVDIL